MRTIVYIHGFLSSPKSFKAQVTAAWLAENHSDTTFICPELSSYPDEAVAQLASVMAPLDAEKTFVIGSSLGGFWATWLVEQQRASKAVLVNPAVAPYNLVQPLLGQPLKSYYTDAVYTIESHHLDTLIACDAQQLTRPEAYWLMVQTGDATLPYQQAVEKYKYSQQTIEEGGSHTFEGFENWLPKIMQFLKAKPKK